MKGVAHIRLDSETYIVIQNLDLRGTLAFALRKKVQGNWRLVTASDELSTGLLVSQLELTPEQIADSMRKEMLDKRGV